MILQSGIDPTWVIGLLVTILLAVLTTMGGILKIAYDASRRFSITLYGDPENGNNGIVQKTKERHEQVEEQHEQVYEQLLIQGRLLSELSYTFSEVAEELEESDDVDVSVNVDRIERLRDRRERGRWESNDE